MPKATLDQIKAANPMFFSPEWGEYGEFVAMAVVGGTLRCRTKHGTSPVYLIGEDYKLSFLRQGW